MFWCIRSEKTPGISLKSILFQKLLLPFTVGINCSSDLKSSRPSASITRIIFSQRRSENFLSNLPTLKSFMDIPLHFIEKRNRIVHYTVLCTVYLPSNNNEGHFSLCKTFAIRDKVATVSKKYIFLSKPASKELTWQRQLLHRERKSRLLMHFEPRSN